MALPNLEDPQPEKANADSRNPNHRAGEEEKHQEKEDDIVDGKDFGRHYEKPIDRVEDLDVSQHIAAMALAHGILRLVYPSQKH